MFLKILGVVKMAESEQNSKYYYNKATVYSDEGKYTLAVDNFKKALAIEPDSIEIIFNLGITYINKKEYDSAVECFEKVLKVSPDEVAALSNIALAHSKKFEFDKSINYYKKVLEINPEDTSTFKDLGDVYTKDKQYDNAIEYYNNFLKAHPTSNIVKESLKTVINLQKNQSFAKPANSVKEAVKKSAEPAESAESCFNTAVSCVKEQKFDIAIEHLRKCLKINPHHSRAYDLLNKLFKIKEKYNSGELQNKTEEPVKKEEPAKEEKAVFIDYRKFNEFITLAMAYYNMGNFDMALENFVKGSEVNPNDNDCNKYINELKSK